MTQRRSPIFIVLVMAAVIGAIFFAGNLEPSSAQNAGYRSYQLRVFCRDSQAATATFWHEVEERPSMGVWVMCAGACPGGTVSIEAALAGIPAGASAALKGMVEKHQANGEVACVRVENNSASKSGNQDERNGNPPPEKKCEKPAPWFGDSADCSDIQAPAVAINTGAVTVSICGYPVFRHSPRGFTTDDPGLEAYRRVVLDRVQQQTGSKICCNKLRDAARTGTPCYPAVDIDCDGKPNQTDVNSTYAAAPVPDINLFTVPNGENIDPFPPGLDPDDPDFHPERTARDSKGVGKCACKWELIKGELTCSPDGRQPHVYLATWRCPESKAEVFTTKYAPTSVPCTKPNRAANADADLKYTLFENHALKTKKVKWAGSPFLSGLPNHYTPAPWHFLNFLPEPQ